MPIHARRHSFGRRCSVSLLLVVGYLPLVCGVRREAEEKQLGSGQTSEFEGCVNANNASSAQLKALKGIGKILAKELVAKQGAWTVETLRSKLKGNAFLTVRLRESKDVMVCEAGERQPRTMSDTCLDINEATEDELMRFNGWDIKDVEFFVKVQQEAKCFTDMNHMKEAVLESHNGPRFWADKIEFYAMAGMLCVSNKELSNGCDPEPIQGSTISSASQKLHWKTSIADCSEEMPQIRDVHDPQRTFDNANMQFATYTGAKGWHTYTGGGEEIEMCKDLFPYIEHKPSAAPLAVADNTSLGVCMFVRTNEDEALAPLMYSEFNIARGLPNFVAFKVSDFKESSKVNMAVCRHSWRHVCHLLQGESDDETKARCHQVVDRGYDPGKLINHMCSVGDGICKQQVGTRGHMNPASFNSWDETRCKATMTYLNAFPSRTDFDGGPWASREQAVRLYLKKTRAKDMAGFVWMIVGVGGENDGEIRSLRTFADKTMKDTVDVPKYVWSALFDPRTKRATGWMCRNGLRSGDPCHCIDKLSIHELQRHVGFTIFPQLEDMEGVDLSDGSNDLFWDILQV